MIAIIDYWRGNLFSIYNGLREVYDYPVLITGDNIISVLETKGLWIRIRTLD